jgi:hypothetical protein
MERYVDCVETKGERGSGSMKERVRQEDGMTIALTVSFDSKKD